MPFPTVTIDPALAAAWPAVCLGCLTYAVEVRPENPDLWNFYRTETAGPLLHRLETTELAAMPGIGESRAACRAMGADPGRHRVSSEALYRRIRQGKDLYHINSLVDANNLVSLETGLSLGSYDAARIGDAVILRVGRAGESYAGIGKADLSLEGMPLLADADGPFGSPTSDSTRAMITEQTREALTVIYGFPGRESAAAALDRAESRLIRFAGVTGVRKFLVEAQTV